MGRRVVRVFEQITYLVPVDEDLSVDDAVEQATDRLLDNASRDIDWFEAVVDRSTEYVGWV